jgi:predicted nucleic acid-binding protein
MEIVSDASVFLAVALNETDRDWIINKTTAVNLVAPEILQYEIGNALIAVRRKGRLDDKDILQAFEISQRISVKLVEINIRDALRIAIRFNIYAYDAYYIQCCIENKLPLLSLDECMCGVAKKLGLKVVE